MSYNSGIIALILMAEFIEIYSQLDLNIGEFDIHCGEYIVCKFPQRFCNSEGHCDYCAKYCNNEDKDIPPGCLLPCYVHNGRVIPQQEFDERCRQITQAITIPEKAQEGESPDDECSMPTYIYVIFAINIILSVLCLWKCLRSIRKTPSQNRQNSRSEDRGLIKKDDPYLNDGKASCTKDGKYVTTPQNDRETESV